MIHALKRLWNEKSLLKALNQETYDVAVDDEA